MPNNPQSVEQVFGEALDLPPEGRSNYLAEACRDAPKLRRLVEELLAEDQRAGSFLAGPVGRSADESAHGATGTAALSGLATQTASPPAFGPRFQPSQHVAGRFVVVRFLARGGMGEVYEVEDSLLQGVHVALKMILPEIAADEGGLHRFEQEVLLARKLTHPNLCPIYEIFRCEEPAPAFLFLTMKLLHGETLQARLRRSEPIPQGEAAKICHQLTAGVAAIHTEGIIHRDIKPNNVMLERTGDKLCVSIMDFGLARLHEAEATMVQAGTVAGTPGYLAPELLAGGRPTQATDLFALGVVFHQVLTGERPIESRNGRSVRPRPSLDSSGAAPELVRTVRDLLADDPEQRCRSFGSWIEKTQDRRSSQRPSPDGTRHLTRRRFALAAASSACVLAGGAVLERQSLYNLLHPLPSKRFVAVLNWPPLTDERVRPMILGLMDAVADELARAEAFDRNFFVAAQKTASTMTTPAQLNEVRESLGANLVLATSARTAGNDMHVSLHVLEPATGRQLRSKEIRTSLDQQFSLPQRVVRAAAELLDVNHYDPDDRRSRVGTENPEALAAFQAAEAYGKQGNDKGLDAAIEKYKQALELDPKYALAQTRLGWAYLRAYGIREDAAALAIGRENCEAAIALNPDIADAHVGLAWVMDVIGDHTSAFREVSKALSLDPDNAHTLIEQAQFYIDDGQYVRAEESYKRALKLRPNYWLCHSEYGVLLDNRARFSQALLEFQSAALLAPSNALVQSNVGSVYLQLGQVDSAVQSCKRSVNLNRNDGAAVTLAAAYRGLGYIDEAIGWAKEATSIAPGACTNWVELGDCYSAAGKLDGDRASAFSAGIAAQQDELRVEPKNGPGHMLLSLCCAKLGRLQEAKAVLHNAEVLHADDITSSLIRVRVLSLLGQTDEAISGALVCLQRGATSYQIQKTPDIEQVKQDPGVEVLLNGQSRQKES